MKKENHRRIRYCLTATGIALGLAGCGGDAREAIIIGDDGVSITKLPNGEIRFTDNIRILPDPSEPQCQDTDTNTCGRTTRKVTPKIIVDHFIYGQTLQTPDDVVDFFAKGAPEPAQKKKKYGVGVQFVVGKDGKIIQMAKMYDSTMEDTYGTANYKNEINIEVVNTNYTANSKDEIPKKQYNALVDLNVALMKQYDIPLGKPYNWQSPSDAYNPDATGVFGHYQLNPLSKKDPGSGFMRDLKQDIKKRIDK